MQHDAVVVDGPAFAALHLRQGHAVGGAQDVVGERPVVEEMPVTLLEAVRVHRVVIAVAEAAVHHPEGVSRILARLVAADLGRPAGKVLAVEQVEPARRTVAQREGGRRRHVAQGLAVPCKGLQIRRIPGNGEPLRVLAREGPQDAEERRGAWTLEPAGQAVEAVRERFRQRLDEPEILRINGDAHRPLHGIEREEQMMPIGRDVLHGETEFEAGLDLHFIDELQRLLLHAHDAARAADFVSDRAAAQVEDAVQRGDAVESHWKLPRADQVEVLVVHLNDATPLGRVLPRRLEVRQHRRVEPAVVPAHVAGVVRRGDALEALPGGEVELDDVLEQAAVDRIVRDRDALHMPERAVARFLERVLLRDERRRRHLRSRRQTDAHAEANKHVFHVHHVISSFRIRWVHSLAYRGGHGQTVQRDDGSLEVWSRRDRRKGKKRRCRRPPRRFHSA